jgi:hypothetical protein
VESVKLGAVSGVDSGTRGTDFFDSFASTRGQAIGPDPSITMPTPLPPPDGVFADGFESGDLSAWSASKTDSGDLAVRASAALAGASGLKATIDDSVPIYVTDWSPLAERHYRARFLFDPNSLAMLDGRAHYLFYAMAGTTRVVARIEILEKSGAYQLRTGALANDGTWRNSDWHPIGDGPHALEIFWQAATGAGSANGGLTFWIDGTVAGNLPGLDNFGQQVDFVQLGAVSGLDSGTHGSMYFDAFESRRELYVGPPSGP